MWSQIVLCLLVGFAYASNEPAWKQNQEYIYRVRGRTLTGLMEVSDQYTGILIKATLKLQPRGDGKLQALLTNTEYTQIHAVLSNGWQTQIQDEELSWKSLPFNSKLFQMRLENGKISELVVSKKCTNWEANMIKGIASLFQLNTNGENALVSPINTFPDSSTNSGVFVAMEDTVLGKTGTLYEIRPIPDYQILNSEEDAKFYDYKQKKQPNGDIIEVIKHEDFSKSTELPAFVFGFGNDWVDEQPASNKMGTYFSRDSTGRAVLVGNLNRYDILYTKTVNTILCSPTLTDQQKGAIVSVMEAELEEVKSQGEKIGEISQPVELGNLVYTYNKPYSKDNLVQQKSSQYSQFSPEEESEQYYNYASLSTFNPNRNSRSIFRKFGPKIFTDVYDYFTQNQPKVNEAPASPLLTYTTGYQGMSIKSSVNMVNEVEKMIKKIATDLEDQNKDHHEKTLDRYSNLMWLIRVMNYKELKQVADEFCMKTIKSPEDASCIVIRDAIANAGTGPALLVIEQYIANKILKSDEATRVVFTMASSVVQPTLEYIKHFFGFIKSKVVMSEWPLNDTALVSFTHLVRKVYVDGKISQSEYPVNSYGSFNTEEGKQFVREEVIPYLGALLNKAIKNAETHKIHAYISAIGNVADARILSIFEPFLEGKKHCSQFQRLLMVLSMGKLTKTYSEEALATCFRIYQNPGEHTAVRIAAVLHIMSSKPPSEMLQIMATNTNIDDNEHVNSVVKYSIEQLTKLEEDEYTIIRNFARLAQPLLTNKEYGLQYGANYIRDYVMEELNFNYKLSSLFIPSSDEYYPKGITYSVRGSLNGLKRYLVNAHAVVSSVDQLIDVLYKQTKNYTEEYNEQKQNAQQQQNNPFSSQNIAKLLNMKTEEREQLEGYFSLGFGHPHRMFSFDNNSIEQFPEYIHQLENTYNQGMKMNHFKLFNAREKTLAIPTAMGVPCMFTMTYPILIKAQGKVSATAQPQLSRNDQIQTPDEIKVQSEVRLTASGKTQGRIAFFVPFEHQQYISGFDKHWEINVPKVNTIVKFDFQKLLFKSEIELKSENKVKVLHYRTWPYTAKCDISNFEPLSSQKSTKPIEPQNVQGYKQVIGRNPTGIALEVDFNHERQFVHLPRLYRVFSNNDFSEAIREIWEDGYIQNSQFDVNYLPEQSSVHKIIMVSNFTREYRKGDNSQESPKYKFNEKSEPHDIQQQLINAVSAGINNAKVTALDAVIYLKGERLIKYLVSGAVAKSNADPQSRMRVFYKRSSEDNKLENYEANFASDSVIPNTNALDPKYALQNEPKIDTKIEVTFGPVDESKAKITAQLKYRRSKDRKEYLKDLPMYYQCEAEMKEGNKQLAGCANITMIANLLDRIQVQIESKNLKPKLEESIRMVYEAARFQLFPNLEIKNKKQSVRDGAVDVEIKFHPDLAYVNISVKTQDQESIAKNIELNDICREVFVAHPVFHLRNRVASYVFGLDSYRDFCTVDKTRVNTFSNRTYEANLSQYWTVMALYAPKRARKNSQSYEQSVQKQLQRQLENYVVLVRESKQSSDKEDVKIVFSNSHTDYKVVEIDLTPSQGRQQKAQVSVDKTLVQLSEERTVDFRDGYIQVYALPNGEVKVELFNAFYVVYDGIRVRFTALQGQFKDAVRGLCGQFNDQDNEDFFTSEACIARKSYKFAKSFEIEGSEGQKVRQEFAGNNSECVDKQIPLYVNVITARNARRGSYGQYSPKKQLTNTPQNKNCLTEQTQYYEDDDEICFTIAPLPSCKKTCDPREFIEKSVGVHCIQNSNVAQLWKNQIDNGGSPNFNSKKEDRKLSFSVPQSCSP